MTSGTTPGHAHTVVGSLRRMAEEARSESDLPIEELGRSLAACAGESFWLESVAARGTKVYPGEAVGDTVRWYTGRFMTADGADPSESALLELVGRVADRVVVLDAGRVIAEGTMAQVVAADAVRRAYLGRTA